MHMAIGMVLKKKKNYREEPCRLIRIRYSSRNTVYWCDTLIQYVSGDNDAHRLYGHPYWSYWLIHSNMVYTNRTKSVPVIKCYSIAP